MGYYSNAGQNIAGTEIGDIARIGGAIAGISHASATGSAKTDIALANEVKGLGVEEQQIGQATIDLENQQTKLEKTRESLAKTDERLAAQQQQYQKLRAETGLNNEAFEKNWQESKTASDKAKEMYEKSMEEMRKRAELLESQRKNFDLRKQLIMKAIERSEK